MGHAARNSDNHKMNLWPESHNDDDLGMKQELYRARDWPLLDISGNR